MAGSQAGQAEDRRSLGDLGREEQEEVLQD